MTLKQFTLSLLAILCMLATSAQEQLVVFTDPHVLSHGLVLSQGQPYYDDLNSNNKMTDLGPEVLQALVDTIITMHPAAVLVPGDLTKNGERRSHTDVVAFLGQLRQAGIKVFATGGIGGVHRGAETTMDISADLEELAQTPVMVICAGAKSILDLGLTLEYLETKGVPVIGFGTDELPAFYTRHSGFKVDYRIDSPEELAAAFRAKLEMGLHGGMLVTNPIPEEYSMPADVINRAIDQAIADANRQGIHGKETTPFLLARVKDLTGGDSLAANIQLVLNNARLAARTAVCL